MSVTRTRRNKGTERSRSAGVVEVAGESGETVEQSEPGETEALESPEVPDVVGKPGETLEPRVQGGVVVGKLEYRSAQSNDIERMAELDEICFTLPWSLADFKTEILKNSLAFYLVCTVDSEVVGYAGLWNIKPEGHITNVAVHPDYRQRGIGSTLVAELLKQSRDRLGLTKFTLEVRVSNREAIRLYSQFGFRLAGTRKAYYVDTNEDALILWLVDS